jgi:uncharacterized membrane protein
MRGVSVLKIVLWYEWVARVILCVIGLHDHYHTSFGNHKLIPTKATKGKTNH